MTRPIRDQAHRLSDELPPPRPSVERETPGEFWRAFATFALLIVALYMLVLVMAGMAVSS